MEKLRFRIDLNASMQYVTKKEFKGIYMYYLL